MGAAAGPLMIIGSAIGAGAAYMGYRNTANAAQDQSQMAMIQAGLMQQQYSSMAAMQAAQAAAYSSQAAIAARTGEILQANEMEKATQAQREGEMKAKRAAELRRMFVGEGKVRFAANGVLLESRPQSAVAMWEQDEATDLAFELSGIKSQVDNEVFGYIWNGFNARTQGLLDAEALNMQAEGARINASNSMLSGELAVLSGEATAAQAESAEDGALWGFIGSLAGNFMQLGAYGARSRAPSSPSPNPIRIPRSTSSGGTGGRPGFSAGYSYSPLLA